MIDCKPSRFYVAGRGEGVVLKNSPRAANNLRPALYSHKWYDVKSLQPNCDILLNGLSHGIWNNKFLAKCKTIV